ncbi:MAG TPA: GIY-YIG nuclease family protein, partial [Flavobacterium sp.]|nr:GIY-YIG nuclease family protein [Flavobacterium sp.]
KRTVFMTVLFLLMKITVYILFSDVHQKHYTGFTSNLEQRLLSHNQLGLNNSNGFHSHSASKICCTMLI